MGPRRISLAAPPSVGVRASKPADPRAHHQATVESASPKRRAGQEQGRADEQAAKVQFACREMSQLVKRQHAAPKPPVTSLIQVKS
jgi:hypothetical protein